MTVFVCVLQRVVATNSIALSEVDCYERSCVTAHEIVVLYRP